MKSFSKTTIAIICSAVLSACAGLPDADTAKATPSHVRQNTTPSDSALTTWQQQDGQYADARQTPGQWWQRLHNQELEHLLTQALQHNTDIKAAISRMQQAQASAGIVAADTLPQLNLEGGYRRGAISKNSPLAKLNAPTDGRSSWKVGAAASWELDFWGYLDSLEDAALERFIAQRYTAQAVEVSLTAEVLRNYFSLQTAQQRMTLVQQQLDLVKRKRQLINSQYANGVVPHQSTLAVQATVIDVQTALSQLQQQVRELENRLSYLTGQLPGHFTTSDQTRQALDYTGALSSITEVTSNAVQLRPDIQAAEAQLRATMANSDAAEADFYPRISLSAGAGMQGFKLSELGNWDSRFFNVGPAFHLPLFNGGRLTQTLELKRAEQREAAIHFRDTVLSAWHEVSDALSACHFARERVDFSQQNFDHWQGIAKDIQYSIKQGAASELDGVNANLQKLQAQQRLLQANQAYLMSRIALDRAVSHPSNASQDESET